VDKNSILNRQHCVLHNLSKLPKKIIERHSHEQLHEFILHEIACEGCFDLSKVIFLIDNPEFNILKGIAGVARTEAFSNGDSIWTDIDRFTIHMKGAAFNDKAKKHNGLSHKKNNIATEPAFKEIAHSFDMADSSLCSLELKHGNHGYLLYEKMNPKDNSCDEYIEHALSLLGFCPIH